MKIDIGNLPVLRWYDSAPKLVELARMADSFGADRFGISDVRFQQDCMTMLAACASATRRLTVESMVTDAIVRHPTLTACAIATIADLSGGRAVLGLGGGSEQPSYWGEDRSRPITALREGIEVIRKMWTGETVDYDGEVIKCHGAKLNFPLRYRIPILVAARGPRALELAGEMSDIVHAASLFNDRGHYLDNLERVKRGLRVGGRTLRNVEIDVSINSCVSEDGQKAIESSKHQAGIGILFTAGSDKYTSARKRWRVPRQFAVPDDIVKALSKWQFWDAVPLPADLAAMLTADVIRDFTVSGTPKQVAERIQELSEYPHVGGIRIFTIPVKGKPIYDGLVETFRGLAKVMKIIGKDVRAA